MNKIVFAFLVLIMTAACGKNSEPVLVPAENFDGIVDGKQVALYTLKGGDLVAQITNYGGRCVSLFTPDREGRLTDIVVGRSSLEEYVNSEGERFLGACVGPVANRIGGAGFTLCGETYSTPKNDNEVNTLHGGFKGLDRLVWDVISVTDSCIVLHMLHPDGFEGYPGNLDITMTYALTSQNGFAIEYEATTDKTTPVNISHHPFFNLRGEGEGTVEDYVMYIKAGSYIPIDSLSIPTGEISPVAGTPFDFRQPHTIGQMIGEADQQLKNALGYDHNWCIDKETDGVELVCSVFDPQSGRKIDILSDQPGLQFYSGNFFDGSEAGKNGKPLEFRSSLALETQYYPDSPNQPSFPSIILEPGMTYRQNTVYSFGVEQ